MKPLVLYHANCADGFCASWVAKRALGDCELLPVNYGDEPPDCRGRDVYVLDFSYDYPTVLGMAMHAASFTLLDHHKTALQELSGKPYPQYAEVSVVDGVSGGQLAWRRFFGDAPAPWLVQYTADRDLWRWELPNSRAVSAALSSHPFSYGMWDILAANDAPPEYFVMEGAAILRYQAQLVAKQAANATLREVGACTVPVVNCTALISETLELLAKGQPFAMGYFDLPTKRVCSLRSDENGLDVSEVAKRRGGGGHKRAAGYEEKLP